MSPKSSEWGPELRITAYLALLLMLVTAGGAAGAAEAAGTEQRGFFGFGAEMEERGARITFVVEGTAAQEAGLRQGDLLLTLDGTSLGGLRHFQMHQLIEAYHVGDRVPMTVAREDRVFSVTLALDSVPPKYRTSDEARERFHAALAEHEALVQLERLMERAPVLHVRRVEDDSYLIRSGEDEWEEMAPWLGGFFDRYLDGAISDLEVSQDVSIRAVRAGEGIDMKVITE